MSNLLSDMPFLPQTAPTSPILDCAGVLPHAKLSQLETQASQAYFKPYVVILPTNFAPVSMMRTSSNIAQQWNMPDDAFLMVINMSGHNLRIIPGARLQKEGLSDKKILQIIATKFGPPMRSASGDGLAKALPEAISNTIDGVNETVGHPRTTSTTTTAATTNTKAADACPIGTNLLIPGAIVLAVLLGYFYLKGRKQP